MLPRRRANKSQLVTLRYSSHWPRRYWFCGRRGAAGSKWNSVRPEPDQVGRCRKVKSEGEKGRERVCRKSGGDECVFIPGEGLGLADVDTFSI